MDDGYSILDAGCLSKIPSSAGIRIEYRASVLFVKLYGRKRMDQMWTYDGLKGIIALRPLKNVPFCLPPRRDVRLKFHPTFWRDSKYSIPL